MAMEKEIVKKLHREVNQALAAVAKANGFVFNPGNFTYTDLDVRGKMSFIKADKQVAYADRHTISSVPSLGLAVGDKVKLNPNATVEYKITSFGKRGGINVERLPDGKPFRIPGTAVSDLTRVGVAGLLQPKPSEAELIGKIVGVYNHLSPENLACDGEASLSYIRRRGAQLRRELRDLFNQLGREVEEGEAYDLYEKLKKDGLL